MFCGKCGNNNPDTSAFCLNCGNQLKTAPAAEPEMTEAERKHYRNIGMIATGIFAVLVIALVFALFGGKGGAGSPEKLVKQYMNAYSKGNAAKIFNLVHDKEIDYMLDMSDMSKKEYKEKIKEASKELKEEVEDYKISYKIENVEDASDARTESLKTYYKEKCDLKVKDVKQVNVKVTIKDDGESETHTTTMYAVKIGGSWYLPVQYAGGL